MGRPRHLAGMSAAFSWTLPPYDLWRPSDPGAPAYPPDSLRALQLPHLPLYLLVGLSPTPKLPTGCGWLWPCLLCVTFILFNFTKHKRLRAVHGGVNEGQGLLRRELQLVPSSAPSLGLEPFYNTQGSLGGPLASSYPPRKPPLCWTVSGLKQTGKLCC